MKEAEYGRVALYIRRSRADETREKQTGEDTLTAQLVYMEDFLKRMGIDEYKIYKEVQSGSTIEDRPVFKGLLELIDEGHFQSIAVKEVSRITRGAHQDLADIELIFKRNRTKVITDTGTYDLNDASNATIFDIQTFTSRQELNQYRARVKSAKRAFAMMGKWMPGGNAIPYGYTLNKKTRKLEVLEETADIIRLIYSLYLDGKDGKGMGDKAISSELYRMKIKSPRGSDKWDASVIKRILTNPAYCGDVLFNRTEELEKGKKRARPEDEHVYVKDAHEAIIEREVWEDAQEKRKGNSTKNRKGRNTFQAISTLTGLIKCKNCKKHMYKSSQPKNGETIALLRCRTLGCNNNIMYNAVEKAIIARLNDIVGMNKEEFSIYINEIIRTENHLNEFQIQHREAQLLIIQKKIEKAKKRLRAAQEMREDGEYTREEFLIRKKEIESEVIKLRSQEQQISKASDEASASKEMDAENCENVLENLTEILDYYQKAKTDERRNGLLSAIFHEVEVKKIKPGFKERPPILELDFVLKDGILLKNLVLS
ncbi:recombinase family protein [Shimazuella kribbensis]|uniref:recombinase family protein n=1 Tax=Shimazuella kribbensis TaxID=139808 RepID=UPI000418A8C9|nr:recombinase family protein [Shimazuella kribbensis]